MASRLSHHKATENNTEQEIGSTFASPNLANFGLGSNWGPRMGYPTP